VTLGHAAPRIIDDRVSINGQSAFHEGRRCVAVAVQAYYDGSGGPSPSNGPSITLAGYAARPEFWAEFEPKWNLVLAGDGRRPAARYLHMKEVNGLQGEFSRERGWDEQTVKALLVDVGNCLSTAWNENQGDADTPQRFSGVSCTVWLNDYASAVAQLPELGKKPPEAICVDVCVSVALRLLPQAPQGQGILGKTGSVELCFDTNEGFLRRIFPLWRRPFHKRSRPLQLVHRIRSADMERTAPLQAADYLAWNTNRHLAQGDLPSGIRRVLSAPMVGSEYDLAKLLNEYRDWKD
jgi:hypothetical protein